MTGAGETEGCRRGRLGRLGPWFVYCAAAAACTLYLNARADLVPKWGAWYDSSNQPYVLLQVRAFLHGRLALVPHPWAAGFDYDWGRGGMHSAWGLGVPILATPFHLLALAFGGPGFPDGVRFLIQYGATMVVLARVLDRVSLDRSSAVVSGTAAAGFLMVFPSFVGLISARFLVYDQTIATGALWSLLLLAGVVGLLYRCTTARLLAVSAAAGFAILIRPTLAIYGATTVSLALFVAQRERLPRRALMAGAAAYVAMVTLYLVGNALRFGSPLTPGYANCISGAFVNRLARWGLPFATVPFGKAAKELFATLFLLEPVHSQIMMGTPPESVRAYAVGERWREYYSPTFDLWVLFAWLISTAMVAWKIVDRRLWRAERTLRDDISTIIGAWAIPPVIALFIFYARLGNLVTRYATDMYPAFAAAALSVGMFVVASVGKRRPAGATSMRLTLAGAVVLYNAGWRGWAEHLSRPLDRAALDSELAAIGARARGAAPPIPDHFTCGEPRERPPVDTQLDDWHGDCSFSSGLVFAMRHSRCVAFTFASRASSWGAAQDESLRSLRATADFDALVSCGAPEVDGETRRVTMCEPHPPSFLLDGMRLYSIATLDDKLEPIDRLKMLRVEPAHGCR